MQRNPSAMIGLQAATLGLCLAAIFPSASHAYWRTTSLGTEAGDLRFNTLTDAHHFIRDHYVAEETGAGTLVGDQVYSMDNYRGEHVSKSCFQYDGSSGNFDPVACTGDSGTVYYRTGIILPADESEISESPFLDRDSGEPSTSMCVGNPIHLGTGNKFQAETDYRSGGGDPLVLTRYYNSQSPDGSLGGWRHTYSRSVDTDPATYGQSLAVVHRPEGQSLLFYQTSEGWNPTWRTDAQLAKLDTGWEFRSGKGVIETFDNQGRLISIARPNGNTLDLSYQNGALSTVTDGFSRTLTFQYAGGNLASVIDPSGQAIQYQYDGAGLLGEVTYQDATSRQYLYDDPDAHGLLSGLIDEDGNRYATWDYDAQGRAIGSEHAGGAEQTTVSYNTDGSVSVTNALGHVQTYSFSRHNGKLKVDSVEGAPCTGFAGGVEVRGYDSNGMLSSTTDRAGQTRQFSHNDRGLEVSRTDKHGARIETVWHPEFSLPVKITGPESVTEFTYDSQLRVTSKSITQRYTSNARSWSYTYHPESVDRPALLATIDGPRSDVNDVTDFGYDAQGNLTSMSNALGHITQFENHDAHGRPGRMIDPNGVARTLVYDARGRLTSVTGPEGGTSFALDDRGLMGGLTAPNGVTESYLYDDAHRLVAASDSLGNTRQIQLDDMGNGTEQRLIDASGQTQWLESRTFNELGWMTAIADAYGNQTLFEHDLVANLTKETDPEGHAYRYEYDGFHHKTRIFDPLNEVISIDYEDTGEVTVVKDPRSRRTYYQYNAFGEVTQIRSPDTGETNLTYDSAGNLATRTDEKGQTTTYDYDALGRVTRIISSDPSEPDVVFGYDDPGAAFGIGRLTSVDDGNGLRTFSYTAQGWLAEETWVVDGLTLTTAYEYDAAGQLEAVTHPTGREVSYVRDAAGRVVSASMHSAGTKTPLLSQIERAPFGPVTGMVRGNGLSETRTLDMNYRVTDIDVPGVHSLDYDYTASSHIETITDTTDPAQIQTLQYDPLGQLTGADGAFGALGFTYDESGNRTSVSDGAATEDYTTAYLNNWLLEAGLTDNRFDANGNMIERGADLFTYDSRNRLVGASAGGHVALYTYNHLNQRASKSVGGVTRLFVYDQAGNLIAEIDADTGLPLAEYIWLEGTPIAFVQSGQTYHVHVDHLGTPQALTDAAGQIAWQAEYTPFGAATVMSQGPTFNLRFPGQYYDVETGLHYNWHRYYDPDTGRYITSDPIGLAGGINTYAYALNNPITSVDPTGLCPWCLIGAALGGGLNAAAQLSSGQDFDWGSFVASIATGGLGGGLGTVTRGLSWGQNIVVNTLGSGAIGAGVTVAKNEITGSCDNVWDSAKRSAFLGGLGSGAGNVLSGLGKQLPRAQALRWWRDASLTDRLFASSNAIYSSQQKPFVTTFFVTTGNAGSSLISNIPERGEQ